MKDIYLETTERLTAKVPEIVLMDLDCGQIDTYKGQRLPLDFPLALLRISIVRGEDKSRTESDHHVQVVIRLAWEAWPMETANITPSQWKGRALQKIGLVNKVIDALQGWGGSFFDYLTFVSAVPQDRSDGLMVYRITFESSYENETD